MNAEIIAIGSELLLGQIIDTNSASIAVHLAENGIELVQTTSVGDDLERMKKTIEAAIGRSEIVITTGGIGPTEDDLTREAVAQVTGHRLVFQSHLIEQIEAFFKTRGFQMPESNRKQAYIPETAMPIENPRGTAPGFVVETPKGVILTLPGVPSEVEYLMKHSVIPFLRKRFAIQHQVIRYRVLRVCGLGESSIGHQIKDLMKQGQNPSVGTLASSGDIKIRITAKADTSEEASSLIQKMEQEIRGRLGILIYGVDDETLHEKTAAELERLNVTLSVVETFTGGTISQKLAGTLVPSFVQGMVLPSMKSQCAFLGLSQDECAFLRNDPKKFAEVLAEKTRNAYGTDLGLAVFAEFAEGENNGEQKVTFYSALATATGMESRDYSMGGELLMVRERASIITLDMLRKYLLKS